MFLFIVMHQEINAILISSDSWKLKTFHLFQVSESTIAGLTDVNTVCYGGT